MEEINLKDFWDYYKRYLKIVIAVIFLFAVISFSYSKFIKKPMYSTSTTIVLVKGDDGGKSGDTIDQSDITLNQKLVSTYSQIIKSRLVVNQIMDYLK